MKLSQYSITAIRRGILDALPISGSYLLFAAIFGTLSLQTGLTSWQSVAMSAFVYTGAAQFTALSMLAEQASIWAIILTTLLLNTRHLLMGLSMAPYYQGFSLLQVNTLAFFLTDEQYAIALNRFRHHKSDAAYTLAVSLSLYLSWVAGTWIGTVAGRWIPDPASLGLGFSFTAMFLALAYYQLLSAARILTFIACGAAAVGLALVLPNGLHLLMAGILAFAIGCFMPVKTGGQAANDIAAKEVESV
jgi:4-azaleucine resistance transporter AzlC